MWGKVSYDTKVISLGPIAYWPMQETSGTTMTALVGSNGTYHGGVTFAADGPSGDCLPRSASFDGTDDYASAALNLSACNEITVSFWMWWSSFASVNRQALEHTADYNSATGWVVYPNTAYTYLSTSLLEASQSYGAGHWRNRFVARPSGSVWHHYAVRYSRASGSHGSTTDIRIDATSPTPQQTVNSDVMTGNFTNSTLYVMSRGGSSRWGQGRMAALAVFPRWLTDNECNQLASPCRYTGWSVGFLKF